MPVGKVYDAAANQVLFSPVSNFYQGKAIRQDQELRGLQIDAAKDELANAPNERVKAEQMWQMQYDVAEANLEKSRLEYGEKTIEIMAKSLSSLTAEATERALAGDVDGAVAGFNSGLSAARASFPDAIAEKVKQMDTDGSGDFSAEELKNLKMSLAPWWARDPGNKSPRSVLVDGKPEEVFWDKAGNMFYEDNTPVTGKVTPFAVNEGGVVGITGDSTLDREITKANVATRNLVGLIERTTEQIDAIPQAGVGLTGKVTRGLDDVASELTGIYQVLGGTETIGGKDVPVGSLLDPSLYEFTGDLANASAAIKSNYITLAYLKARSMEPGGRLAKDDVKLAMDSLGGDWASKGKMKAALNETTWQALNGLKNYYKATGNISKFPKDLYEKMDDLKSSTFVNDGPTMPNSQEEYDALKPGDKYLGADGKVMVKK